MTIRVGLLNSDAVLGYNDMGGRGIMLDEVMKELKVKTKDLAEMTGISIRTLESYRNERREPALSVGLKIADALGVDPHRLVSPPDGEKST